MCDGFTINVMTLMALMLALGLLVDDAIVVVENVERIMSEEGLSPRHGAARKAEGTRTRCWPRPFRSSRSSMPIAFMSGIDGPFLLSVLGLPSLFR